MRFDQPRPLTAAQQFLNLRVNPACAGNGRLCRNGLTWSFSIAPTPLSRCYDARIVYGHGTSPRVFIDNPDLTELADGRRLPHVYKQRPTHLCLFLPGSGEWGAWLRLDQTIVPWTAVWLLYFEQWLISGEWAGGGVHPIVRERGSGRARRNRVTRSRLDGVEP
jgi:hypothetical protein